MTTWDAVNKYYSGQGVVLMGQRDANGKPKKLYAVGNVSSLKVAVATSVLEHKESQTGARGVDLRLTTEVKASLSMVMENYIAKNLAQALRGDSTFKPGATVTGEAITGYAGYVTPLANVKVSSAAIKKGATTLTAFTNEATPYDYRINAEAGSIKLNDGEDVAFVGLATAVSAVTVGSTTSIDTTVAHGLTTGDKVYLQGFTGADAADLNNKTLTVTVTDTDSFTVAVNSTGHTITATSAKYVDLTNGISLTADYTYADQYRVDGLTQGAPTLYLRFEGLNTADNNDPVVIEVFAFSTDPLKELDMISDGVQQFTLDGSVLADPLQLSGSKYFKITKLS